MTITEFLSYLDTHQIDIWIEDSQLYTSIYNIVKLPNIEEIEEKVKKRILNNDFSKSRGWLVANYGEVYCYQYSFNGHIFIERNLDESVDIYRCKFNPEGKVVHIRGLQEGISFSEAYQKAKAFLDWFYSSNPNLRRNLY